MEQLLQVRVLLVLLVILLSEIGAAGQGQCSLIVKVVDSNEREVEARVVVIERNGREVRAENELGGVRFCDLGLLPVTVTVGSATCNQVTLRNVPLEWGRTKNLKVVYDFQACMVDRPPPAACQILFRFSDEQNQWLSNVSITPPITNGKSVRSDQYGRLRLAVPFGPEFKATTDLEGFISEPIRALCTPESTLQEHIVKLRKK